MSTIRTRIAPSPTGPLHIGTARTALFNYLFAEKHGGKFVLRIEDTDLERSDPKYEKDILESLHWLGIEWDEGPVVAKGNGSSKFRVKSSKLYKGKYGPYRQSERTASYKKYIEKLFAEGKAFYCFHSEAELDEEKSKLLEAKHPPLHLCEYRTLDPKEAEALARTMPASIIRFKTPAGRLINFRDLIRGELTFESGLLGDFSIAKRADAPLYNFAVVVDDFEMKISHVIRGEDHLSNTPKQLLLIEALGFAPPAYAHLPLILGTDRSKLSKRHGATAVSEYREQGYLPETLFNFMALLGWNPGDEREILSKEELINEFLPERVQKSGAVFDIKKLDWMNGEYIRKKSVEELTELCLPYLKKTEPVIEIQKSKVKSMPRSERQVLVRGQNDKSKFKIDFMQKVVALEQPRLKKLSEIGERIDYFFRAPQYEKELLRWKTMNDEEILSALERAEKVISDFKDQMSKEEIEKAFLEEMWEDDKGVVLWPLRAALTGKKASPGPFEIIAILGAKESLERLRAARALIQS